MNEDQSFGAIVKERRHYKNERARFRALGSSVVWFLS